MVSRLEPTLQFYFIRFYRCFIRQLLFPETEEESTMAEQQIVEQRRVKENQSDRVHQQLEGIFCRV